MKKTYKEKKHLGSLLYKQIPSPIPGDSDSSSLELHLELCVLQCPSRCSRSDNTYRLSRDNTAHWLVGVGGLALLGHTLCPDQGTKDISIRQC